LELVQITLWVMFIVDLSEFVPMAVNCTAEPSATLAGAFGVIAMEDNT
jgi:hypothetical protein